MDVTLQVDEGKQYFINRIRFNGNTTTRDSVVRRELRIYEEGVFNTEALKFSIKRVNQLAYFKQLEGGKDVDVKETPGADNKMDVTLKFEEQNRNQLQFGAGVSQYEGFFGTLGFQTANFLGRGETFSVNLQAGSRAQNYVVAFTEPYLFDRPITGGVDVFKRRLEYIGQFTQDSIGGNIMFGFPLKEQTRMFLNYSYEHTKVLDLNPAYLNPALIASNPYLASSLLLGAGGARTISKIVPSVSRNTVDNPIFPNSGKRFTVAVDLAGLGGDTAFWKPFGEVVMYFQHTKRTIVRVPGAGDVHLDVHRQQGPAHHREAVRRRRVQRARLRHPHDRAAGDAGDPADLQRPDVPARPDAGRGAPWSRRWSIPGWWSAATRCSC